MIWTDREKELLKAHYPLGHKEDLIRLLNRRWCHIQSKAHFMRVKRLFKYKPTEETIRRIRQNCNPFWKGKSMPKDVREKVSQAKKGYKPTLATIEKLRKSHLGNKQSEETKKKISLKNKGKTTWILGKHHSEETKQKIKLANEGQIPWIKGKKLSAETRKKISLAQIGKKLSEETKKKIGEASKRFKIDLLSHKEEIITFYNNGYDAKYIGKLHNVCGKTILRRLISWNININKNRFSYTKIITQDGHSVNSKAEMLIDNKLFSYGIKHIRDKKISNSNLRCDWYIPELDLYIEYWGLLGKDSYDKQKERKLKVYEINGLNLLSIFPSDLGNLDRILNQMSLIKNKERNKILTDFICVSNHCPHSTQIPSP